LQNLKDRQLSLEDNFKEDASPPVAHTHRLPTAYAWRIGARALHAMMNGILGNDNQAGQMNMIPGLLSIHLPHAKRAGSFFREARGVVLLIVTRTKPSPMMLSLRHEGMPARSAPSQRSSPIRIECVFYWLHQPNSSPRIGGCLRRPSPRKTAASSAYLCFAKR